MRRIGVDTRPSVTSIRFSIVSGGFLCIIGCVISAAFLPKFLRYDAQAARSPA